MKKEITYIKKSDAIYEAIKDSKVGDQIIVHNPNGGISLILKITAKEQEDKKCRE